MATAKKIALSAKQATSSAQAAAATPYERHMAAATQFLADAIVQLAAELDHIERALEVRAPPSSGSSIVCGRGRWDRDS